MMRYNVGLRLYCVGSLAHGTQMVRCNMGLSWCIGTWDSDTAFEPETEMVHWHMGLK